MRYALFSLAVAALGMNGCTQLGAEVGTGAAIYLTKPATPPPADTADQIPQHESWCYSTMGQPDCYAHPQDVPPNRLINVDPASRYPVDLESYRALVAKKVAAEPGAVQTVAPPPLPPVIQPVVVAPLKHAKPVLHRAKGKHPKAHAKKPIDCAPKPKKAKKPHVALPPSPGPISLQPPPAAPVDLQAEKTKLQDEMSADTPATSSAEVAPTTDARP